MLLKTQSLPCRSRGIRTITLAGSEQGEKLVEIYTCCRYGPDWAQWREINWTTPENGNEATLDLGLDANRKKITSVTGISYNDSGDTFGLKAAVSDGSSWAHGQSQPGGLSSERPSPSTSGRLQLSHLSGDTTYRAYILRFHWRPQ